MTKKNTISTTADGELELLLAETRASLRTERFAAAGARPKDSNAPAKMRKTIARILTEQHARALRTANA
jgi:ribosomal protein L29